MPPPPLPVEEQLSTAIEELPPPVGPMDIDEPPSPPQAYYPMTGAKLKARARLLLLATSSQEELEEEVPHSAGYYF
ncbi:uncharacterized protein ARMOST_17666 [Armillaria ostoyae]|uniref:Uncharacterized protein n=1 Tax=Armillaria ostoyae TaxID=47428 RepID=A0A284RZN4_ARMOS|nr:uncharacterized protein ARMOST_17666 [Armillaria ostoyae]